MTESTALQLRGRVPDELPAIPIKNAVVFPIPNLPVPLSVGRDRTLRAIEAAAEEAGVVFVVAQLDPAEEDPGPGDLYTVGTIARVLRMNRGTDAGNELLIEGIGRGRIEAFLDEDAFFRVRVSPIREELADDTETDALVRNLKEFATKVIQLTPRIPDEAVAVVEGIDNPSHLADLVASQLRLSTPDKQALLEITDVKVRLTRVIDHLAREAEVLEISNHIRTEVRGSLDKHQREVYLREQLRAIQRELGEDEEDGDDLEERRRRRACRPSPSRPPAASSKRISRMNPQSAEYTVARSPWTGCSTCPGRSTPRTTWTSEAAEALLDRDHFGLEKVKRRIIEYLAVRKLKGDMKGPILCLVGPPGVGKTSSASRSPRPWVVPSSASASAASVTRRRSAATAGPTSARCRAASSRPTKRAGTMNPVIVLDEIDKLGHDFRGDRPRPSWRSWIRSRTTASAITTSRCRLTSRRSSSSRPPTSSDPIPAPLRDRMEVIGIPGYIEEKQEIARRHLVPRQLDDHGLTADQVTITDPALGAIIQPLHAGGGRPKPRPPDRRRAAVGRPGRRARHRRAARHRRSRSRACRPGSAAYLPGIKEDISTPGVINGLAWTPVGGDILFIEAMHGRQGNSSSPASSAR
ncbi:MAG: LON peptidase substrate-binding domain-containing protein [bacterium]